jgi:hypothetical protein
MKFRYKIKILIRKGIRLMLQKQQRKEKPLFHAKIQIMYSAFIYYDDFNAIISPIKRTTPSMAKSVLRSCQLLR